MYTRTHTHTQTPNVFTAVRARNIARTPEQYIHTSARSHAHRYETSSCAHTQLLGPSSYITTFRLPHSTIHRACASASHSHGSCLPVRTHRAQPHRTAPLSTHTDRHTLCTHHHHRRRTRVSLALHPSVRILYDKQTVIAVVFVFFVVVVVVVVIVCAVVVAVVVIANILIECSLLLRACVRFCVFYLRRSSSRPQRQHTFSTKSRIKRLNFDPLTVPRWFVAPFPVVTFAVCARIPRSAVLRKVFFCVHKRQHNSSAD